MGARLSYWNEAAHSRLIEAIYAAAVTPGRWNAVLQEMAGVFWPELRRLVTRTVDRKQFEGTAIGVDDADYQAYMNTYFAGSIYGRNPRGARAGHVAPARDYVPAPDFQRTTMYQEYWRPRDKHEALHLGVHLDEAETFHYISLVRPRNGELFQTSDVALAQDLMPHLNRASAISQRLRKADLLAATGLQALDLLTHGVLLLDSARRIIHVNAAAEAMLAKADAIGTEHGALTAVTPGQTGLLQALLARTSVERPSKAGSLRLPKRSGGAPLALLCMPFQQETHWLLAARPVLLVCITDPDDMPPLPASQLTALFGLTGKEAELAADLLSGHDLRDIADLRDKSLATIRTHLTRLMAKTNTNRQSDLMRLLASLPRSRDKVR